MLLYRIFSELDLQVWKDLKSIIEERSPLSEQNNFGREPVKEDITNNSSKLLQTVKDLKIETETVKKENERILRAQEELNQILLKKFHNEEKDKQVESKTTSYQHKSKRSKHSIIESSSSFEINRNSYRRKH